MDDKSDTFDLVGRTLADKYEVERVVARGGFGVVYYARHVELDVPVALKVLMVPERFSDDERVEFLGMFRREARTIAALNHGAIVRVIDYGTATFPSGESPWMALEWLDGRTLEADLAARPSGVGRSPSEALELLRPAFDALACAHAASIAHRDVKPANLMLVPGRRGASPLRVLDFGIAKVMDPDEQAGSGQTATRAGISSYSLFYAAPEQVSHARTGPWTDVHAMALIVVEVLTGRRAFQGSDPVAVFGDILDRERPTPKRLGVDVGPWEPILARALARLPAERHPDADALLAALEGCVAEADAAWRTGRGAALAAATAPAAGVTPPSVPVPAPKPAQEARPDTLSGASGARSVPPSSLNRKLVPVVAVLTLALVAVVIRSATQHDEPARAPAPVVASPPPVAPEQRPVAPAPVAATPPSAPPVAAPVVAAPVVAAPVVAAPAAAPAVAADDDPVRDRHRRRGHHAPAAPAPATAPAPEPAPAPAPTPAPIAAPPAPAPPQGVVIE